MRIVATDLTKRYGTGENQVIALHKANLEIQARDFISIVGPSGSGKSTLLHLISGLDYPTEGVVEYRWSEYPSRKGRGPVSISPAKNWVYFSKISFNSGPNSAGEHYHAPVAGSSSGR